MTTKKFEKEIKKQRAQILDKFQISELQLGKTEPVNYDEYMRAVAKLQKKALRAANRELKDFCKKNKIDLPKGVYFSYSEKR